MAFIYHIWLISVPEIIKKLKLIFFFLNLNIKNTFGIPNIDWFPLTVSVTGMKVLSYLLRNSTFILSNSIIDISDEQYYSFIPPKIINLLSTNTVECPYLCRSFKGNPLTLTSNHYMFSKLRTKISPNTTLSSFLPPYII